MLPVIFAGPPDANRGDMLVVINLAVEQFLGGHNPYRLYHVPWEMALSYGPGLWAPYILPKVLGFDSRVLALIGQLAVPAACGLAAVISTVRAQWIRAVTLLALAITVAFQPAILQFFRIGHTTVYWPLLLIFAVLVVEERWTACCVALGFLVAARSTMVAIVPVFLLTLHVRRALSWKRAVLLVASAIAPFLPFLGDIHNLVYGLFGAYQKVMKGFVWHQTTWALTTFGLTSPLLKRGLEHFVELTQVGVMAVVYLVAWIDLRRGRPALPWMVVALLAFSMTTLWPVLYIYFDVWVLALCGLAATAWHGAWRPRFGAFVVPATLAAAAVAIVLIAGKNVRGSSYTIDVGTRRANGMTGGGFGRDIREVYGKRTFVWVEGTTARIGVPRAGLAGGRIRIAIHPFTPVEGLNQTVTASLNGHSLGMIPLHIGWQDIDFEAQRSFWQYRLQRPRSELRLRDQWRRDKDQ